MCSRFKDPTHTNYNNKHPYIRNKLRECLPQSKVPISKNYQNKIHCQPF